MYYIMYTGGSHPEEGAGREVHRVVQVEPGHQGHHGPLHELQLQAGRSSRVLPGCRQPRRPRRRQPDAEPGGHMHIYIYIYVCVCIYIYIYICIDMYTRTHTHIYLSIYLSLSIYICIYIYIDMYTHTHTYIYIYIYLSLSISLSLYIYIYIYICIDITNY